MKRCPNCNQIFLDDSDFCLEDGTRLVVDSGNQAFGVSQTSGEMPTQVVPLSQSAAAQPSTGSSPLLYLVIGVLATALAAVVVYLLLLRDDGKKAEIAVTDAPQANSAATFAPSTPSPSPTPITPAAAVPPSVIPGLSPSGTWTGDWNSRSAHFKAAANLNESGGRVDGKILWTLIRHSNPQKSQKGGSTAVEYVRGTFDPTTRAITLAGYRKEDPDNIVVLDRYNLTLSADGKTMNGRSKSGGSFVLRQ